MVFQEKQKSSSNLGGSFRWWGRKRLGRGDRTKELAVTRVASHCQRLRVLTWEGRIKTNAGTCKSAGKINGLAPHLEAGETIKVKKPRKIVLKRVKRKQVLRSRPKPLHGTREGI